MDRIQGQRESLLAAYPLAVTEPRISTPALVVLLGSTPALAGLELMRHMLGLQPKDLHRVGFVYIDTDDPPSSVVEFQRQHKGLFQEFLLRIAVPAGIDRVPRVKQTVLTWDDSHKQIIQKEDDTEQHTFIQGKKPQYFANGAGGIRNNGHVAACFNYRLIYDALNAALSRITRLEDPRGNLKVREVQANLVAFLGGGTGSGMLADITVMVRELLVNYQFKQRINLFCILPESSRGVSMTDLSWRKSNATAGLLELLAYSRAAAATKDGVYEKYMRGNSYRLTDEAIANEVYLVGHSSAMGDASDTARIVGLDLFQRITDASGVGLLEHSQWVDRRTLGENDDRGLPAMFGISCPLEVQFPVQETATAFAQISSARLLPLIAGFMQKQVPLNETEKRHALRKWRNAIRFGASVDDPLVVNLGEFRQSEFDDADITQLDILWARLERQQRTIEQEIQEIVHKKYDEEMQLIAHKDGQRSTNDLLLDRVQYLRRLLQGYELALEDLRETDAPKVPARPIAQELKLSKPNLLARFMRTDHAGIVCTAYNDILHAYANAARYRLLEALLKDLIQEVQEALNFSLSWFRSSEGDWQVKELAERGLGSMAWRGRLDYPHPHQRHLFDLRSLQAKDGRSVATERLYCWATGGNEALEADISALNFTEYVASYIEYANRSLVSLDTQGLDRVEGQITRRMADQIVEFFREYYMKKFETMNLLDLLEKAAPLPQKGQSRSQQIGAYLFEHLKHLRGLVSGLVAFEGELWHEGLSTLNTSLYLGINFRDGNQRVVFERVIEELGPLTDRGQNPRIEFAIDPHRLQLSYGQHAISLSTIRDFYLDQNSSMEAYLANQAAWEQAGGIGNMPVHSSGQAQFLICHKFALGSDKALAERVIRGISSFRRGAGTRVSGNVYGTSRGFPGSNLS